METGNPDIKERIQNSIDFLEDNLEKKIKLEDLAKIACYSMFHYHRVFKQTIGQTAMDYLRKRRLARATQELKDTTQKIVDIALKYQFCSQESFTRAFTNEYGISPAKIRYNNKPLLLLHRKNILKSAGRQNPSQITCISRAA